MKHAKLALAAIAIFAVAGGAFAFKARNTHSLYFTTAGTTRCTFEVIGVSTITAVPNQLPVTTIPTALATAPGVCTTTTLYYTAN